MGTATTNRRVVRAAGLDMVTSGAEGGLGRLRKRCSMPRSSIIGFRRAAEEIVVDV